LFLATDLGASLPTAGLFYLTNLTAPVAGYLVGARSDRTGDRFGLYRSCVLAGGAGYLAISISTTGWMAFVVSSVVLGFAATAVSQLFAALHDDLAGRADARGDDVVNVVRMALTAGWVVGPTLGTWLAAAAGQRVLLAVVAVCTAGQLVPFVGRRARRSRAGTAGRATPASRSEPHAARAPAQRLWPLLAFTGLFVLVYAGEPIKFGYLPLYMRDELHLDAAVSGAIIGVQPLVELMVMPFTIALARRVGGLSLMSIGALLCTGANVCFAATGTAMGLFTGQVLMGGVWGIFATLGLLTAQRLLPCSVATASALFLSAPPVSSALGGLVGGSGVALLGLPHVFLLPAGLALLAATGLAAFPRSGHP
ncbi:MAG: MFS transporter, partial [Actinobacteria bacterium]|nr:MFS transporter [Actinomycetota bacterium]